LVSSPYKITDFKSYGAFLFHYFSHLRLQSTIKFGNGKGHPIPLFKGLRLKKLLIIGGVRFEVLEEYVRRSLFFYRGRKNRKKLELKAVSIKDKYQLDLDSNRQSYESSRIWATRQSLLWRWQRVREWFDEFSESYEIE